MKSEHAVHLNNLCKEFEKAPILNRVSIHVNPGEIYGILGANGAGKTTMLKVIGGYLEATDGEVKLFGHDPWRNRNEVLKNMGSIIETPFFYEHLTAQENLAIHLSYMEGRGDIASALERVGLANVGKKMVSKFSLGMRQRLAIARSFVHKPKLLLLDEPINGLDPVAIREMRELFMALKNEGTTILLSSHILNEVEQVAERVAILDKGQIVLEESMSVLKKANPNNLENYLITKMSGGMYHA